MGTNAHQERVAAASDAALANLAVLGDAEAFRVIMQRNNRPLFRIARSILRDDAEAEDVVQEAYVRAYAGLQHFRAESSISTWLTRIVLNEALARLKSRKRTVECSADETMAQIIRFPGTDPSPDPEMYAAQRQIRRVLESAIDGLPGPFRLAFVLREIEGLSLEEIACQLSIPVPTVKTRLFRARRLLRQALSTEMHAALKGAFPFDGARCARLTEAVLQRLRL